MAPHSFSWHVEHTKWVHSIQTSFSALWLHLHSRQSWWYIQTCNKLLTPPTVPWTTGASCLWLVGFALICLWQPALASQWCHSSTMSLADQRSHAVKEEVWSSLQTTIGARYILCLGAFSGLPTLSAVKYDWQQVQLFKAGPICGSQMFVKLFQSDIDLILMNINVMSHRQMSIINGIFESRGICATQPRLTSQSSAGQAMI